MDYIQEYIQDLHATLELVSNSRIKQFIEILNEARLDDRQVFVMGNGGSAATASHFVGDLGKNTRVKGMPHFRIFGLTDNIPSITAYANDVGYEYIFSNQIEGLIREKDVLIGISASGNSRNVLNAIELGNSIGAITIGLTGFDGGQLAPLVNLNIHVPSSRIEQIEDIHMMIEHVVVSAIKKNAYSVTYELDEILSNKSINLGNLSNFINPSSQILKENKKMEESSVIMQLSHELNESLPNYDTLQRALQFATDTLKVTSASLMLLGKDGGITDGLLAYGGKVRTGASHQFIEIIDQGLAGWVVKHNESVIIRDTSSDPRWLIRQWDKTNNGTRSAMSVPLFDHNQVIGVITVTRNNSEEFNEHELSLLTTVAAFVSLVILKRKQ